jgi:hypothetical protein
VADSRTREELADDADDGSAGPIGALDAHDLALLEVGEAGVRLGDVGAHHDHGEVAPAAAAGARRHRFRLAWLQLQALRLSGSASPSLFWAVTRIWTGGPMVDGSEWVLAHLSEQNTQRCQALQRTLVLVEFDFGELDTVTRVAVEQRVMDASASNSSSLPDTEGYTSTSLKQASNQTYSTKAASISTCQNCVHGSGVFLPWAAAFTIQIRNMIPISRCSCPSPPDLAAVMHAPI